MRVQIKRVYEAYGETDGYRVLVDRLWPRGIKKVDLSYDLWAKQLAPSTEARKEFGHKPENFDTFKNRYRAELDANPQAAELIAFLKESGVETLTLLYAAKDPSINHAVVLREWIQEQL